MTSYLEPNLQVPSLPNVEIYTPETQPLHEQLEKVFQDTSFVVNDKKRRYQYLQTEDITNDIWVDGSPIYVQTYATGVLTAGINNPIPHNIVTLDTFVDVIGSVSDGTTQRPIPYPDPTAANSAAFYVDATNLNILLGAGFGANYSGYITIFYTKA